MNKKILFFIIFILIANSILAIDIGLSPSTINFENMLKEGYAKKTVTLSTSSPTNITGHIEVRGEISDWLSFDPTNYSFVFSSQNPLKFSMISQPPKNVANGMYRGSISFVTDSVGKLTGSGSLIKAAVELGITNEIIGDEIVACSVGGIRILDIEAGKPIGIYATVLNQGNVRLRPVLTIDIWNQQQTKIILTKEIVLDEILPTLEQSYYKEVSANLARGQYWATVSIKDCKKSEVLTFSVLNKGGISDKGKFIEILIDRYVYTNVPVQIKALFRNEGIRAVNAKFIGEVRMGKKLIQAIETDVISIDPKQVGEIPSTFTPKKQGEYTVRGRVLYNKKLSFETSTNFEAIGEEGFNFRIIIYPIIYLVIMALVIFMIILIRKEKKNKHRRH